MKCKVCEGTSFTEDFGLLTCDGCGTEVENAVTLVESQDQYSELNKSRTIRIAKEKSKVDSKQFKEKLGLYESYNIILHSWTKTLLSLGASHRFKKIIFELWIWYLQRTGLAFIGEADSQEAKNSIGSDICKLQKNKYCYFPSKATIEREGVPKVVKISTFASKKITFSVEKLNVGKLLGLVYVALVLAEEPILLIDLIRWCREGHIPYFSAQNLLPPGSSSEVKQPTGIEFEIIKAYATDLAMYLNILHLPIPNCRNIMDRVVKSLKLPGQVGDLALGLMKKLLNSEYDYSISIFGIEMYAMASVISVLKDFWGLNDSDEYSLSSATKKFNEETGKKSSIGTLFCWEEWQAYINKSIWYCGEIDYVTGIHSRHARVSNIGDVGIFLNFGWTEGIWRLGNFNPQPTGIIESQCHSYAERLLQEQGTSFDTELNQPHSYKPTQMPIYGSIEQFVSNYGNGSKYEHLAEVGQKLLDCKFSEHLFIIPATNILQEELKKCGSGLKIVDPVSKTCSEKEEQLLYFMPQPLQEKYNIKIGRCGKSSVTSFPSRSIEWLVTICFIFFEVDNFNMGLAFNSIREFYSLNTTKNKLQHRVFKPTNS